MDIDDQRWELAGRCGVLRVHRPIEKRIGRNAALGWKLDRLGHRDIGWIDRAFRGAPKHVHHAGLEVGGDDGHRFSRRSGDRVGAAGARLDGRRVSGEGRVDGLEASPLEVNRREAGQTL